MKRLNREAEMEQAAEKNAPRDSLHTAHRKEFEVQACVVPMELSENEFLDRLLVFTEDNGWSFGGGVRTIVDGRYLNEDGTPGKPVWLEEGQ